MENQDYAAQGEQPYTDCFARSCCHHVNGQCEIHTNTLLPTITVDGTCLGYDL